jgi:nucleotide-binding universal stress UspA family protein
MKTILVPTDFSTAATNAALYAATMAKDLKATVHLITVFHLPITQLENPDLSISVDDLRSASEKRLQKEAEHLQKKTGAKITSSAKQGFAVEEILQMEKEYNLIIMGIKEAGRFSEFIFGSISTDVMRKTNKPLLIIPEKAKYTGFKNIAFACDYDPKTSVQTVEPLLEFAKSFDSKISIINVIQDDEVVSMEEAAMGLKLENKFKDVEHAYFFPESDDMVDVINEFSSKNKMDVVALIPHRHNFLERIFHRSNSKKMAFHSEIPCLALPDIHKSIPIYVL